MFYNREFGKPLTFEQIKSGLYVFNIYDNFINNTIKSVIVDENLILLKPQKEIRENVD